MLLFIQTSDPFLKMLDIAIMLAGMFTCMVVMYFLGKYHVYDHIGYNVDLSDIKPELYNLGGDTDLELWYRHHKLLKKAVKKRKWFGK